MNTSTNCSFLKKKKHLIKQLFLVIFFGFFLPAQAQQANSGAWYMYVGNNKISKKLNWHNEAQYRNYNWVGDLEQFFVRTGIGYNLSENNNNVLLGYAFIVNQAYKNGERFRSIENRVFQQYINFINVDRVYLQNRYRLEERFLENDFKMRFRYLLGVNIPLNNKEMIEKTVYLSLYDEIFLNFKSPVFDRNRAFGALGYKINKDLRFEVGYLYQLYENSKRGQFQLVFYNSIPYFKN